MCKCLPGLDCLRHRIRERRLLQLFAFGDLCTLLKLVVVDDVLEIEMEDSRSGHSISFEESQNETWSAGTLCTKASSEYMIRMYFHKEVWKHHYLCHGNTRKKGLVSRRTYQFTRDVKVCKEGSCDPDVLQFGHELAVEAAHGVASEETIASRLLCGIRMKVNNAFYNDDKMFHRIYQVSVDFL